MEKGRAKDEKKEKHSFRQILSNNFYMIGIAYRACPPRVIWPFLMRLITQFRDIFTAVVFMGQITKYIEEGAAFRQALPFLIFP